MYNVAIVDYGMGNIDSVARAVEEAGAIPIVTDRQSDFETASSIILPGVGSFAEGMDAIRERKLDTILAKQVFDNKIPFLGICLGMQLLGTVGFEVHKTKGLGWIDAEVVQLEPSNFEERVPHVGWNQVYPIRPSALFADIPVGADFYFVHSFHIVPREKGNILSTTDYCGSFVSAVRRDNIFGVQFHPEKSLGMGIRLIRNFVSMHQ
jgi:imidazole glycerol-phosphate synthase subunit HisH